MKVLFMYICSVLFAVTKQNVPEQGKFELDLRMNELVSRSKTLDKDSIIRITVSATKDVGCTSSESMKLTAAIQGLSCMGEYANVPNSSLPWMFSHVEDCPVSETNVQGIDMSSSMTFKCLESYKFKFCNAWDKMQCSPPEVTTVSSVPSAESRRKRLASNENAPADPKVQTGGTVPSSDPPKENIGSPQEKDDPPKSQTATLSSSSQGTSVKSQVVNKSTSAIVPLKGAYLIMLKLSEGDDSIVHITIEAKGPYGYLSPHDYPLLIFYMVMCIVYALYGFVWLVMSACNYRDLLRVQFWISVVIVLGMMEKAVFYSEYLSVNTTGISVAGAAKFAEIVSALKRSVARMLVIIVSLGFGIVKPRLGPMLHRVIGVGILYFILAIVEAMVRNDAALHEPDNKTLLFTYIPVAVLDSIICWWVFMSLLQTMKTLRLRRNTTKLSLYRHFSNLIIFCVLSSTVMLFWSMRLHSSPCLSDWSELWVDTAFWHILFSIVLLVIMILWRPNANNQRYAYSPMIDGNDSDLEDLEEAMLGSGATEGMKMRGAKKTDTDVDMNKTEEDLKWIEENIPQTIADAALPSLLDSDEEVMTTKYEMSKME